MTRPLADSHTHRPTPPRGRFEVVQLEPEHARDIMLQTAQAYCGRLLDDPAYLSTFVAAGPCYTVLVDGHAVACFGIHITHPGIGMGWGILGRNAGPYLLAMTRAIVRFLKTSEFQRVQIMVACDYPEGHGWATLLGFHAETPLDAPMRACLPGGGDAVLYAWLSQSVNHRRH